MKKVKLKWNHKLEKKLYNLFRRTAFKIVKNNNGLTEEDYSKFYELFFKHSVDMEKKWHKSNEINVIPHIRIALKQSDEVKSWTSKTKEYYKINDIDKKKVAINARFRARNMLGNHYKDFLKEIASQESEFFEWNTQADERVREEHQARHNVIYDWDYVEIVPGEEINCRCWAEVYFPENKKEIDEIRQES